MISVLRELVAIVLTFSTYLFRTSWLNPTAAQAKQYQPPRPVILVHGYLHSSSAWHYIRYRLLKEGYGPIYTVDLGSPFHSIKYYAQLVADKIAEIQQATHCKKVPLVGHSMGGIVCSYCASYLAPESVKQVITLGSPFRGTKLAVLGIGKCVREVRYVKPDIRYGNRNEFMKKLQAGMQEIAPRIPFFYMGSKDDLIVRPPDSTIPEFVLSDPSCYRMFEGMGHLSYLWSPTVVREIVIQLQKHDQNSISLINV